MQYLRNLQGQLSQSLWIRSHREPNKQRDFNDSSSNISIISSSDITRFSTLSTSNSPYLSQRCTTKNTHNTPTKITPVVPHFVDSHVKPATASYQNDDIIASVITSSSTSRKSKSKKLSTAAPEIKSVTAAIASHNSNNNNNSNCNNSPRRHCNRVWSSVTRRERNDTERIICSSFQQSSRGRSSSFSSSSTGKSQFQPVILSLTPLSKSVKREYCKSSNSNTSSSGITSIFHSSTSSPTLVFPTWSPSKRKTQLLKKNEPENKNENQECLKDIRSRIRENIWRENNSNSSESRIIAISSPTLHHRQADHEKQSSLLPVDDPLLQLLDKGSRIVQASSHDKRNKEEKVPQEKRKKIEKRQKDSCYSTTSSSNSEIDDEENVFVADASEETNESTTTASTNNYTSNNNNKNNLFVVTSGTSLDTSSTQQQLQGCIISLPEIQSEETSSLSQEQQLSPFVQEATDKNVTIIRQRAPKRTISTPTRKNWQPRRSSIACSSTTGSSSLFWDIEQAAGKIKESSSSTSNNRVEARRQIQSCRTRAEKKEYGKLHADRENIRSSSSSSKSVVSEKSLLERTIEDKDIQEKFKFLDPPPTLSRTSKSSASSARREAAVATKAKASSSSAAAVETEVDQAKEATERTRRTSQDQSFPTFSSRITTFTRDRPCSSTSSTTSGRSSSRSSNSSSSGTFFDSPVSSVSDLASVILVTASREPHEQEESSVSAPVVVSPSSSSASSISTLLSQTSTTTITNADVLPLFNDRSSNSKGIVDGSSNNSGGVLFVEGFSCSHRVNQRKKSINSFKKNNSNNNNSGSNEIINSEKGTSKKRKRFSCIIQYLLCTKGFSLFGSPKKLLSAIFRRRRNSRIQQNKNNRLSLSFSPSYSSSSASLNKNNNCNSKPNNKSNSSSSKKFNKRARRRRQLLKLTNQAASRGPSKAELRLWATMDHEDLIRELPQIEKLSNQERLRLAHKRRMLQLKKFQQYEKELNSNSKKHKDSDLVRRNLPGKHNSNHHGVRKGSRRIRFRNSIMLLEAAGRNDVEEVRLLLESGVNPDVANEDGLTALHQCCIDDNEEMMKILLDYGANVNSEDSERWTPLHAAATCGHLHLVQHLIARGANLLAVNAEGNMAYDITDEEVTLDYIESEMAKRGVTQELIEEIRALPETKMLQDIQRVHAQGGDLESRDVDGATPLHIASANGYYRAAEFLLDNHAATDVQDKDFWQPIHAAACWGHLDVLELLVQNGADLDARTKNNETPYAICEDPEIKERIIQLRTEQQTKRQNEGRKRPSRTHSTNSRTQSIRRTSQRDKGLTSKRDAADEAQMLRAREELHKENSPSPTADVTGANKNAAANGTATATTAVVNGNGVGNPDSQNNVHTNGNENASSEEDPDDRTVLPPHVLGRDSVGNMKLKQDEMNRLREIAVKSGSVNHNNHLNNHNHHHNNTNNAESNGGIKMNNLLYSEQNNGSLIKNKNNIHKNLNNSGGSGEGNSPVAVLSSPDDNGNLLPKPEINPTVDNKVPLGSGGLGLASGMPLSGSRDNLVGLSSSAGNSTIDIHVSVTINTNSPVSTLTNGGGLGTPNTTQGYGGESVHGHTNGGPHSIPLSPGSSIFTPPGTLSDLKKQRSLIRTSSNPLTNGTLTNLIALPILPTSTPPTSSSYSPSFETFKPSSSASCNSTTQSVVTTSSASASTCTTNACAKNTFSGEVVSLSPAALLSQNNQKNTSTSFANCSQSSASSWHYYWSDWRNSFTYSQSQFDSAAFSSNTLPSTCSSGEYPSASLPKQQLQQPQLHAGLGNNKSKGGVSGGCSIVGGVPVLPTSATSSTLFPLGSYYFNSSVGGGSNGGSGNTIPYDSASPSYNSGSNSCSTNTNNNPFSNNQHCCYLNNLTGGMNDAMTKYHPPASPTMSLRRYVGDPAETVGDYGDGGKRCCVIV